MSGALSFTPQQRAAVQRRDGALLLAANAGSGKTSVLVERYVAMVMEDDIAPGAILAVTFTDRAAGEMRARIRRLLIERGGHEHVAAAEAAWISTLHGFCSRVLRQHALAAGIDPGFRLLDEGEARALRTRAFEQALAGFMADEGNVELVAAFTTDLLATEILGLYDLLRTRGERAPTVRVRAATPEPPDPEHVARLAGAAIAVLATAGDGVTVTAARQGAQRARELLAAGSPSLDALARCTVKRRVKAFDQEAYAAYEAALGEYLQARRDVEGRRAVERIDALLRGFAAGYEQAKRAGGAIDYADLELLTRDLLTANPVLAASYRERFARVMVDEFQDINPLQLELLELLDTGQTFVVGDEFQSIYGFRHADVGVFRARRAALSEHGAALVLPDNFRSHPDLLGAVNALFEDRFGEGFQPLVRGRRGSDIDRPRIELLLTDREWEADDDDEERDLRWRGPEARLIAARVAELVEADFRPRDVAVLVRAASDMHIYERALESRGIPTLASGGRGFWARRQIRDLLALLTALANPRDEVELFALLASPLVGLSSTGLVQIADGAAPGRRWEALMREDRAPAGLAPSDREALARMRTWFEPLRRRTPQLSIAALLDHAITTLGYDGHVLSLPAGRRKLANLFKLQRLADEFEAVNGRDIRGFVDRARAELEADAREPDAPIELGEADAVQLMTMHAAKGLEFPVVVCADLGRRPMSRRGRVLIDGERVGLRLPSLRGEAQDTLDYRTLCEEGEQRDRAEEDRVLYVAMTRAQELLVLSGGEKLEAWPEHKPGCPPIRWVAPGLVPDLGERLDGPPVSTVPGRGGAAVRLTILTQDSRQQLLEAPGDAQTALNINDAPPPPAPADVPRPPLPAVGVPTRISYSSLADYGRCPYQYYLRRVLRLPEADPGELGVLPSTPSGLEPRVRGSIVHELLEAVDFSAPALPGPDQVRATRAALELEDVLDEDAIADCLALVGAVLDSPLAERLRGAAEVGAERGFSFAIDAALVNGFVDVIAQDAQGALVIDYKTDAVGADDDLEAHVGADYAHQRAIYALAALRSGAERVEVVHWFLNRPAEPASASFTQADAEALEQVVRDAAAGLLAGDFAPTAVPHRGLCAACPGRAALCSYEPELTERELPAAAV